MAATAMMSRPWHPRGRPAAPTAHVATRYSSCIAPCYTGSMSYQLDLARPLGDAIRAVVVEQTRQALADITDRQHTVAWRVHELRKHCKKTRALFRLIRPGFPDYKAANRLYRDTARLVAPHRDARVLANLAEHLSGDFAQDPVAHWFDFQAELAQQMASEPLHDVARMLRTALARADEWRWGEVKPKHVLKGLGNNLAVVYERSDRVSKNTSGKKAHEWRKCVKDHWYQLRLLRDVLPERDRRSIEPFGDLGELIGDAHDRDVFVERLDELPGFLENSRWTEQLEQTAVHERKALQADAVRLAGTLLSGSGKGLIKRVKKRWAKLGKEDGNKPSLKIVSST